MVEKPGVTRFRWLRQHLHPVHDNPLQESVCQVIMPLTAVGQASSSFRITNDVQKLEKIERRKTLLMISLPTSHTYWREL